VRIDAEGSATIAGQAPAGGTVVILLDGEEQARARIGGDGSFAALFDIPPGAQPRVMLLEVLLPDGTRQRSDQTIIITPPSEADPQVVAQADLTGVPVATLAQGAEVLARAADLPNAAGGAVGGGSVDATASVGGSPDLPEAPDGPQMSEALADEDGTAPDIEAAEARLQITELAPELAAEVDAAAVVDGDAVEVASVDLEAGEARPVTVPETVAVADAVARDATTDARPEAEVVDAGATDPVLSAAAQVEREPVDAGSTNAARPGDTGSGGANSSPASAVDVAAPQVSTTVSRAASQPAVATATPRAPSVLLQDRDGLRLLQPATPPATAVDAPTAPVALAVDAISYGAAGEVRLDGRGKVGSGDKVLVYLDNDLRGDVDLGADGRWSMELTDVVPGLYTLRADQIGADGAVSARFETPFQREAPEALADVLPAAATGDVPVTDVSAGEDVAADSGALSDRTEARETLTAQATDPARVAVTAITVQPGYTLWGIASDRYGDGFSYVKIFEANGGQIRDPDLIYPGQVFDLPK
jgi:nucleoid-associated protein YgaU